MQIEQSKRLAQSNILIRAAHLEYVDSRIRRFSSDLLLIKNPHLSSDSKKYLKIIPVQSHLIILEILVISENNLVNLVSSPYLVEFHVNFQLNILYAAYVLWNKQTKWTRENLKKKQ